MLALILKPQAGHAQEASLALERSPSNATVYAGSYDITDGFKTRNFIGMFANTYLTSGVGFHADIVAVNREQDAAFAALGVSFIASPHWRPRIVVGTSTNNDNILPSFYISAQAQFSPVEGGPTIISPTISYRKYRNHTDEILPSIEAVHYFDIKSDPNGYYAVQGRGSLSFSSSHSTGWSVGAGLQTVRHSGVSFGLYGEFGHSVYDNLFAPTLPTDFYTLEPTAGVHLSKKYELFVRGEFSHNDFYTVQGALAGIKLMF